MAIVSQQSLLAKVEATYSTDPTPAGANAVACINEITLAPVTEDSQPVSVDAFLDSYEHVEGSIHVVCSFSTPLKGSGSAGTEPEITPLLKACGFKHLNTGATSDAFTLASTFGTLNTGYQSATFYIEDGTHKHQLHGCYGTLSIEANPASFPVANWTFTGLYERPTDVATFTAPTYDTSRPQPSRGLTMTLGGVAGGATFRPVNWTLDLNREVHLSRSMAASFGIAAVELGRCVPAGTFGAVVLPLASHDWYADLEAATLASMSMVWNGGAGNITTITTAGGTGGMAVRTLDRGEDNGVMTWDAGYSVGRSSGNDSINITFT